MVATPQHNVLRETDQPDFKLREAQLRMTKALRRRPGPSSKADPFVRSIMPAAREEGHPPYVNVSF
jgi:hypothetical protein